VRAAHQRGRWRALPVALVDPAVAGDVVGLPSRFASVAVLETM